MLHDDKPPLNEDLLVHFGVKGMHWGIRKEEESAGPRNAAEYVKFGNSVQTKLSANGVDLKGLKDKYGPESTHEPTRDGLSRKQKIAIGAGVGVAAIGIGAALYYGKRGNVPSNLDLQKLWDTRRELSVKSVHPDADGLALHWNNGISLPKGQIFPRISSKAETQIRPHGFYAAFRDDDVNRYKAVLPTFWESWGIGSPTKGGVINNYRAKVPIKAPSGEESFGIFKSLLGSDSTFRSLMGLPKEASSVSSFNDNQLRALFLQHANNWKNPESSDVPKFFSAVKAAGFNALIDFNDAGALSHSPMRLIDGSLFEIVSHEKLHFEDMLAAAKSLEQTLVHSEGGVRVIDDDKPPLNEDLLVHFGVKGMHWGVRKEEELVGRKPGAKPPPAKGRAAGKDDFSDHEKAVLKAAGFSPSDSATLQSKYGEGSLSQDPPKRRLTPQQKKLLGGIVVAAGVAGAAYYMHRQGVFGDRGFIDPGPYVHVDVPHAGPTGRIPDMTKFTKEWAQYQKTVGSRQVGYSKKMVDELSTEAVSHKAGTIFRRVSTAQETSIRPGGFYASANDADVERYKAILPVFWRQWGSNANSGYIVNIKANADINAPSPKHTFELFKSMLNDELPSAVPLPPGRRASTMRDLWPGHGMDDDAFAQKFFPQFAQGWANDNHPATKHFFTKLKQQGYNALVDMNDAGALSKQPMRLLDGSLFSIDGHDSLTREAIIAAQESIQTLVHFFLATMANQIIHLDEKEGIMEEKPPIEDALMHFGVKGMKWGVHKSDHPGASRSTNREARKDAQEFARAKLFYGEGAGTRRKLIKASVEAKSKRDPTYKAAFEHHLGQQDLSQHAERARSERRRKDTKAKVGKNVRAANRAINGPFASGAAVALAVSAYGGLKATGLDKRVMSAGRTFVNQSKYGTKVDLSFLK